MCAYLYSCVRQTLQTITDSLKQALAEARASKLRTTLSLLGITIGIFCIIAVLTVLDSMQANIRKEVSTLGSDVLYVGRWPWMDEGGEYKWWEFWQRPSMSPRELRAVEHDVPGAAMATLCLGTSGNTVRHRDAELEGARAYAVTTHFDRIQSIEIGRGRYLSASELEGGAPAAVLGEELYDALFPGGTDPLGEAVTMSGKKFVVVGVMKKTGQNMAGFDFDEAVVFPYQAASSFLDLSSLEYDPTLIIRAKPGVSTDDLKYEVEGVLRRVRKVRPGAPANFAINQLSQITERLGVMFTSINLIGWIIGGFSLIVGAFGIANIMFVTVKERTRTIGLKKAIGAPARVIRTEFLTEAVTLCIIGGLVGIVLVLLLSLVLTHAADFPVTLTISNFALGVGISAGVGILAGYIPARRASKLDPVVAIRSV